MDAKFTTWRHMITNHMLGKMGCRMRIVKRAALCTYTRRVPTNAVHAAGQNGAIQHLLSVDHA